jgi:hypothetical protein
MKTIRLAILTLAIGAFAAAAIAQSGFIGRFTLPHQVRWGQAMLPAGEYSIDFSSIQSPAIVRSMDGTISTFVFTGDTGDSQKGPSSLTLVTSGNEWRVASVNLPRAGVSLVYSPVTQAERETLTKAKQIETVPLVAANK